MPGGVDIIWYPLAIAALKYEPGVLAQVEYQTRPVVQGARADAPKRTGAGAASIRSESSLTDTDPGVRVSWERDRYYMRFHEQGTKYLPARPFLVPALDRYL